MPSWDNQMSIPDQSHTNPGPIIFQSGANQMPIQGHSLDQSRIIWSIFLPIQANPLLIQCQFDANPRSIFLWIFASPCQSMPILANPMPISCQSVTTYGLNHRTSPPHGMVPNPLGGTKPGHPVTTQCKLDANPGPNWSIFLPIHYQSGANLMPVQGQLFDPISILQFPKMVNQSQS